MRFLYHYVNVCNSNIVYNCCLIDNSNTIHSKRSTEIAENKKNINNSIVIIDDDKWIVKLIRNMLEKYDFTVIDAMTPHEGLELIITEKPLLMLLDLSLPGIDGDSLLYLIKNMSMTKDTNVIIL